MKKTKEWLQEFDNQIQLQDVPNEKMILRAKIEVVMINLKGITNIEKFEYNGVPMCGEEVMAANKALRMLGDFEGGVV